MTWEILRHCFVQNWCYLEPVKQTLSKLKIYCTRLWKHCRNIVNTFMLSPTVCDNWNHLKNALKSLCLQNEQREPKTRPPLVKPYWKVTFWKRLDAVTARGSCWKPSCWRYIRVWVDLSSRWHLLGSLLIFVMSRSPRYKRLCTLHIRAWV